MNVLTESHQIRRAVMELLSDKDDLRIVAVAFIGVDALDFLPKPAGVEVYCWPRPGGTNPKGIEDLRREGARVNFVEGLHSKIFWSQSRGTLIGSANLSANALGKGGLHEAVVRLEAGAFDIRPFIKSLPIVSDFASKLEWLHVEHVKFLQRNPVGDPPPPRPVSSFGEWLAGGEGRAEWRLGWYESNIKAPADAVDALEQETGDRNYKTYLGVSGPRELKEGVYTLGFYVQQPKSSGVKITGLHWWAPKTRVTTVSKQWAEWPYIWFAKRFLPRGVRGPFNCREPRFQQALTATVQEAGGLPWLYKAPLKPTKGFLKKLADHYGMG